jgi:hypothetical protein
VITTSHDHGAAQGVPEKPSLRENTALPDQKTLRAKPTAHDAARLARIPLLPYVRMVVRLIDGVDLTLGELAVQLLATWRQHRIGPLPRWPYNRRVSQQHPP